MQILIDLTATSKGVVHSDDTAKRDWEKFRLLSLLGFLEDFGFTINSLYGYVIFDEAKKEAIDCGKPGENLHASFEVVESIFKTGGKLALIFTDKKYIVFLDRYFLAIHFCHMRKVAPLAIDTVVDNFIDLVIGESKELLDKLYLEAFTTKYGEDHEPVSHLLNDNVSRSQGLRIPLSMEKKLNNIFSWKTPDGIEIPIPIYEGEDKDEKFLKSFNNWKKSSIKNREKFGYKISKEKCPHCKEEVLYYNNKIEGYTYRWCTKCDYFLKEKN